MIRLQRFVRPGIAISLVGHVAALLLGIAFVGANSFEAAPPPPDAMVVDVVTSNEAPRLEGTPSNLTTSGSESPSQSSSPSAAVQSPPRRPVAQPPQQQQQQQQQSPQRDAHRSIAQPETAVPELIRTNETQPEMARQTAESPPALSEPHPEETPDQPATAEAVARLALLGGRLGGGFEAPSIDRPVPGYDFTAQFREHVSSCSTLPEGIDRGEKVEVALRVFLNPDGTLASVPQPLEPIVSAKQRALMQNSISALQRCQPYTMLPADKYKQWKRLDLVFFPLNFDGR